MSEWYKPPAQQSRHNLADPKPVRVHLNYALPLSPQTAPNGLAYPSTLYHGPDYFFITFLADLLRTVPNSEETGPFGIVVNNVRGVSTVGSKLSLGRKVFRLGNGWIKGVELLEIPKDEPTEF